MIICIAISDSLLSNHKLHAPSHHADVNSCSIVTEAQGGGEYVDLMVILKMGTGEIRERKGKGE